MSERLRSRCGTPTLLLYFAVPQQAARLEDVAASHSYLIHLVVAICKKGHSGDLLHLVAFRQWLIGRTWLTHG